MRVESEQGTSLDDFPFRFEIAGLTFQIGSVLPKDSLLGVHYEVTVVKNDLLGDDPRRVRKFRFHPGQLQCKWTILP